VKKQKNDQAHASTLEDLRATRARLYEEGQAGPTREMVKLIAEQLGTARQTQVGTERIFKQGPLYLNHQTNDDRIDVMYKSRTRYSTRPDTWVFIPGAWQEDLKHWYEVAIETRNAADAKKEEEEIAKLRVMLCLDEKEETA